MKTNFLFALVIVFSFLSCNDKKEISEKYKSGLSTTKKLLYKLNLIDLEKGLIQKEKIKEIYDLLTISNSNKNTVDTIAYSGIYKAFKTDSLANSFLTRESIYIKNNFFLDSIKIDSDTIIVTLKKQEKSIKRKFLYHLVNDSIIDKNLPPTVYFKIIDSYYLDQLLDSLKTISKP